ncbi:uncharacterized protein G2W53_014009 [Senna tora]|uniref:Uncharacterized protein n=1 Tax=Senna tora TaxID=362788 RepID=A0A834U2B3_9FABA|nr:uncharacterized protein G2W53_014009 [Senna tora]
MNPLQHKDTTVKVRVVRLWFVPPYSSNMSKPNPECDVRNMAVNAKFRKYIALHIMLGYN